MKKIICIALSLCLCCAAVCSGCAPAARQEAPVTAAPAATAYGSQESDYAFENTEEYGTITESDFRSPLANPFSTFSVDVDTASYCNVRRMLNDRDTVPADAVRTEEFLNYFRYPYPDAAEGEPMSIYTEYADCPWNDAHRLLLVGLHARELAQEETPPSNLVFLLDVSGSMEDSDKLPLVKKAFSMLADQLGARDRVSIVTYAGSDSVVLDGAEGAEKEKILRAVNTLSAGGSTAGARGIVTAYEIARRHFVEGGNNRVILATDGDFNVGMSSDEELTRLIEKERESGVFLSVMGFGKGNIKDSKMESLADNGNGNYSYIDSAIEAQKVLVDERNATLFTVAKDVKIQVEFNPAQVRAYRLIGYENRALADKDFANDKKDAGDMGAGHRVSALFEIVPVGSDADEPEPSTKYQRQSVVESDELGTVSVRYKEPDRGESMLLTAAVASRGASSPSAAFRFASSVAEFCLLLRDSPYKGEASYERLLSRAQEAADDVYKYEFIDLVRLAQRNGA